MLTTELNDRDVLLVVDSKAQVVASKISSNVLKNYCIVVHGAEVDLHFKNFNFKRRLLYSKQTVINFYKGAKRIVGISSNTVQRLNAYGFKADCLLLGVDPGLFYPEQSQAIIQERRLKYNINPSDQVLVSASWERVTIRLLDHLKKF